jgi:hypothetical protein
MTPDPQESAGKGRGGREGKDGMGKEGQEKRGKGRAGKWKKREFGGGMRHGLWGGMDAPAYCLLCHQLASMVPAVCGVVIICNRVKYYKSFTNICLASD